MELSDCKRYKAARAVFEDLQSNLTYEGDVADIMISNHTLTSCDVASFTSGPDLKYTVATDSENDLLISCTCIDYLQTQDNCKHMYLVNMIERIGLKYSIPASLFIGAGEDAAKSTRAFAMLIQECAEINLQNHGPESIDRINNLADRLDILIEALKKTNDQQGQPAPSAL
ncbi:hypothetical protein [Absidia glauca]|uniref:SWIM-type domain-containing protein n=1 Tax=Absidia glauca TaxID=4829 RepID=A0A168PYS2_ABSGL|nr:hypothetical protein [Absidia glauca]